MCPLIGPCDEGQSVWWFPRADGRALAAGVRVQPLWRGSQQSRLCACNRRSSPTNCRSATTGLTLADAAGRHRGVRPVLVVGDCPT